MRSETARERMSTACEAHLKVRFGELRAKSLPGGTVVRECVEEREALREAGQTHTQSQISRSDLALGTPPRSKPPHLICFVYSGRFQYRRYLRKFMKAGSSNLPVCARTARQIRW